MKLVVIRIVWTHLLLELVGTVSNAHGEDAGEDPWRGAHEEGGHVAESEGLGESRLEEC